jgi:hypothetical protein
MADPATLRPVDRAAGYHNPARGDYRLAALRELLRPVLSPVDVRVPVNVSRPSTTVPVA